MTSIALESGRAANLERFRAGMAEQFALAFERRGRVVLRERLIAAVASPVGG